MAQANAYGSITIVDMTDIERIYVVYAKSANSSTAPTAAASTWTESIASAPGNGNYIWQRTVVLKSGPTDSTNPSYGNPICVTGPEGQAAKEISAIETQYCNYGSGTPGSSASWQSSTPAYDTTKPNYWTRTRLKYADNTYSSWTAPVKDQALTDAIYNAYIANSIAVHAQEDAEGALSQANSNINEVVRLWQAKSVHSTPNPPPTEVTTGSASTYNNWSTVKPTATDTYRYFYYCDQSKTGGGICTWSEVVEDTSYLSTYEINALNVRIKNFFKGKDTTYDGWFASGRTEDEGLRDNDAETYFYNARFAATNIALGYNKTPVINLDGSNGTINIYRLPTIDANTKKVTKAGALGMQLGASSLNFYEPPVGNADPTIAATLSSTGLNIADGSIILGGHGATGINNGDIALSNSNFTRTINGVSRADLRFAIGSKFGVKNDGTLYASNATISGAITATSLTIGSGASVSGLSTSNISGIDNYALQSDLNTEIAQRKAVYAVSTTGATTAAKTTESGTPSGFVLYNGATVTVKFNSANSTTTPTLNVNGTGAKTIRSYTGAALTAAEYTWPAGAAITFTYDGSYWRMQDGGALQAKADAAASASSASSSASAASSSASSASTSASNASSSATAASNSASTASTKATEASNSASTASSKASAASTSATNAANSASAANTSATNASNSADAAASSASDASDSADAAAGSASTASSKATAAANSATSASNSASSASSSATSASNSASSASSSATTATNQANAAAGSATAASNSATAASGSATAASNSATAASNSATAASNSATAASNSATAAAEVMGGFTILWNYSAFGTSTAGDAFICGFDPATGTKSDANGWIKWNSTKRTITKQQVNPGTIVPYNIPIYIVCRLSSATGTTGTNYMVWYNSGWKYAACPSPTAVGNSWTWTDNKDIILGSFVETGANEVLTECELFNPPWTSKQITTNTTTPTSYIMDTDSNKGITVKPKDSSGNDFLQMNSTAIEFFRNSTTTSAMCLTDNSFRLGLEASNHTTIDTSGLHIWTGTESTATNEVALFSSTARIGKQSSNNVSIEPGGIYLNNENGYSIFSAESSSSKTSVFTTDGPFSQTAGSHTATFSYTPVSGTQITAYIVFDSTRDIYDFTAGQSKTVTKTFGDEVYTIKYNGAKTITITANSSSLWCYVQYAYYYASVKAPVLTCGTDMRGENGRGAFSSAFGEGLEAASKHQFVVGKFNINDPTSFFEVGNGANNDDRNTAFKVMGDGYGQFTGSAATLDMLSADSNKVLRVLSNTNGNRGLYLPAEQKWIARADTNGAVYINGTNLTFPTSGAATLSRDLSTSGYISLSTNGKQIFFADKDNTNRSMIWLNGNNYFGLGYGMYEQNYGDTRIYGHNLRFYSHNTITMSQPLIVAGHDTAIGYVPNQASGKLSNTASNTDITKRTDAKLGLKAGSWVITGTARFTNNATGRRGINLYADSSSYEATFVTVPAATGATTKIQTTLVTVQSSDFTVYMGTQQNSGSQLDVDWYIRAIRIA